MATGVMQASVAQMWASCSSEKHLAPDHQRPGPPAPRLGGRGLRKLAPISGPASTERGWWL